MLRKVKVSESLKDDLKQHVFCELYAKPPEFIIDLKSRGKLRGYISSMVWSISKMKRTNSFARQFGVNETPTDTIPDVAEERETIDPVDLSKLHWYKAELLKLYAELGTYKAVSESTGIPTVSVFNTVKQAKKLIRQTL